VAVTEGAHHSIIRIHKVLAFGQDFFCQKVPFQFFVLIIFLYIDQFDTIMGNFFSFTKKTIG
jgi:hypothetical protein